MSWPTVYAIAAAVSSGLLYVVIWRLPIRLTFSEKWQQIFWGVTAAVALVAFCAGILPNFYLWLPQKLTSGELLILRSDFWVLALPGFFQALFCFVPLTGWFDEETRNRPAFQKRYNRGLVFCAVLFAALPQYFALNAYTLFADAQIERTGYWNPAREYIDYEALSSIEIASERRTSTGKSGPRHYSVLLIHLALKDGTKRVILETEDPDAGLAAVVGRLMIRLRARGIESKLPFILPGQEKWKTLLEENF